MKKLTALAMIAALSATLSACGKAGGSPSPAVSTVTVTAAPEPTDAGTDLTGDYATTMNVALTDKAVWRNGVTMKLSGFRRGKSTPESAPANTDYLKFTITLHNGSGVTLDTGSTSLACPNGDGEIFDGDRLSGSPNGHLLPGKTVSWVTACAFAPGYTQAQIEARPSDDSPEGYRTAIFTGVVQ